VAAAAAGSALVVAAATAEAVGVPILVVSRARSFSQVAVVARSMRARTKSWLPISRPATAKS
jgi:hypothetical protein